MENAAVPPRVRRLLTREPDMADTALMFLQDQLLVADLPAETEQSMARLGIAMVVLTQFDRWIAETADAELTSREMDDLYYTPLPEPPSGAEESE